MATKKIMRGISFDPDVFQALENLRGTRQRERSRYINDLVREKLGLKK